MTADAPDGPPAQRRSSEEPMSGLGLPACEVLEVHELGVTVRGEGGTCVLHQHQTIAGWAFMGLADVDGETAAVFEQHAPDLVPGRAMEPRAIVYLGKRGPLLRLGKTLVPTSVEEGSAWGGTSKRAVLQAGYDVLREVALSGHDDPSPRSVGPLVPPIRRATADGYEYPHTFVGSPESDDVVPVFYEPRNAKPRLQPVAVSLEIGRSLDRQDIYEGLIGGWLPGAYFAYPAGPGRRWESFTFGTVGTPSAHIQPVWYRYLKVVGPEVVEAHYYDSELPYPSEQGAPARAFYTALAELHRDWHARLQGGMSIAVPDGWVYDFCRHAMALEMISRIGAHPRYGVVDRVYGGPEHDGFQDVLTSAATCYLEWGRADVAYRYLDQYLTYFVRQNGALRYRGPEMGQYGRMLTVLARGYQLTGDGSLLLRHRGKIEAIAGILVDRRERALKLGPEDPAYGLVHGRHEADISFDIPGLLEHDYERPYFSNSTEAARGLVEMGRTWQALGRARDDDAMSARGRELEGVGEQLGQRVRAAVEASWRERDGVTMLPLFAGARLVHLDAPYRARPESFDENRVFSEMLYSGVLGEEVVRRIVDAAAANGDSTLGVFGNRRLVVAFTALGQAFGMLAQDMVREFLLLYYTHALHLHTRGTWTAFECLDMDRDRAAHLPFCAPAQMVVPILTKWMLVFEDPAGDELWLGRALPRPWLADEAGVSVSHAPTRWGCVGYEIRSGPGGGFTASLDLPTGLDCEVHLRLRAPAGREWSCVEVDGKEWGRFDPRRETVTLTPEVGNQPTVTVRA